VGKPTTANAIAEWAEQQTAPTHRKPTKRLSQAEVGLLLQLHKEGKSQVEIAQLLGVTQGAISRWLQNTTDSTGIAKSYLRGSALRMAQNIVRNGQAKDHVQASGRAATARGYGDCRERGQREGRGAGFAP
jgi:hypothetical protein